MLAMQLLDRIQDQQSVTGLPLVGITLAAVPCPDTPVILTLHWHGFIQEKLAEVEGASPVAYTPVPSSALQLNERWDDLICIDEATLEAAWRLGAWDVARAERPGCTRAGAADAEPMECLQAFAAQPLGVNGQPLVVCDAPDTDELLQVAARRGYLYWLFRPVSGGIWHDVADDTTLSSDGRRAGPCPFHVAPPRCDQKRQSVIQLGTPRARSAADCA
jgi:hypothetical protein